jgi:hypothetical protein|tara:strand:- start:2416 stop:2520 length:105 start_codon:yes stop_codon:yes gene_type:complete
MGYIFKVQGAVETKLKAENCEVKPKAKKTKKKVD